MLYIMRHGKTDWNAMHKLQGRMDIPLNEEGREMAEKAREEYKNLNIDKYHQIHIRKSDQAIVRQ